MLKRWAFFTLIVFAGLSMTSAQEQTAETVSSSFGRGESASLAENLDMVFPESDTFRVIVDPVRLGIDTFSSRLDKIRAEGREPLGLVLAGGSARAYAHIGVLEVLEEAGIRPDFIVANSMGAVIGMLYAAGIDPATIADIVESIPPETYLNLVLPTKGGFINVDPFVAAAEKIVGHLDLADAKIPIIVTAEDLRTRRQVELAEGDFSKVMATTFAIPAIFEPVPFRGYLLVDGGSTNLVPVGIAAEYSSLIIVSTAFYNKGMDYNNPLSVINRTFDIGKTRAGVGDLLDTEPFVIRNHVENISYMQFSNPESIIELGRQSTLKVVDDLAKSLSAVTPRVPMSPDFIAARERYRTSVPAALAELNRGALPDVASTLRFKLRIKCMDEFEPSPFALDGESYLGFSAAWDSGRIRSSLSTIVGLSGKSGRQWGITAGLLANPIDTLHVQTELRLWGDFNAWPLFFLKPTSAEALVVLDWTSGSEAFSFKPSLGGSLEYSLETGDFSWGSHADLSIDAGYGKGRRIPGHPAPFISASAGIFADTSAGVLRFGPEWNFKTGFVDSGLGAFRIRSSGRMDASGTGVSIDRGDAFRGNSPTGTAPLAAAANAEIVWFARKLEFDVGEILLVKDIELGPYFDCVWLASDGLGAAPDAFAAGLSLGLTWSFAGLKPFDVSLFAGLGSDGLPILGIRSSRLFRTLR